LSNFVPAIAVSADVFAFSLLRAIKTARTAAMAVPLKGPVLTEQACSTTFCLFV
jgi:hypothetical protein